MCIINYGEPRLCGEKVCFEAQNGVFWRVEVDVLA